VAGWATASSGVVESGASSYLDTRDDGCWAAAQHTFPDVGKQLATPEDPGTLASN